MHDWFELEITHDVKREIMVTIYKKFFRDFLRNKKVILGDGQGLNPDLAYIIRIFSFLK